MYNRKRPSRWQPSLEGFLPGCVRMVVSPEGGPGGSRLFNSLTNPELEGTTFDPNVHSLPEGILGQAVPRTLHALY